MKPTKLPLWAAITSLVSWGLILTIHLRQPHYQDYVDEQVRQFELCQEVGHNCSPMIKGPAEPWIMLGLSTAFMRLTLCILFRIWKRTA